MKCAIRHESAGRMRIHLYAGRLDFKKADLIEYYLRAVPGVKDVAVYDRTSDAIIRYQAGGGPEKKNLKGAEAEAAKAALKAVRAEIIRALGAFSFEKAEAAELVPAHTGRELNRKYEDKLIKCIAFHYLRRFLMPSPLRAVWHCGRAGRYIRRGLGVCARRRFGVEVLDATAISVSLLQGNFKTAGSVMFLLKVGEILEEWTHKKTVDDLAATMSLGVDKVWYRSPEGEEILLPVNRLKIGDCFVVRTGNMIPCDGKVVEGEASINQASITGESVPVAKTAGGYVYAGTTVEDGECVICIDRELGDARYDRIVKMIEESEKLKSTAENQAFSLADRLVPYSFLGAAVTWLLTRNTAKAISFLMVDFSCALKLAIPIAVLSAMKQCSADTITVKGGKFLEAIAEADTIVFDKTGTLTHSEPRVASVTAFNGNDSAEMLRLAACLEEHYPHSVANAIVREALVRGLQHEECHSDIEYSVAHGISGIVNGERVVIGSYHFVFEDEKCKVPGREKRKFNKILESEYSQIYMAIGGVLSAVICIEDPVREDAPAVISELKKLGFRHVVMMTGDSSRVAASVAERLALDEYHAEVLPEDKAAFVQKEHVAGRKVVMIGDGINDSPALSAADAGIAISSGAAIAREIADITISSDDLYALVRLRKISTALKERLKYNYNFIIGFNSMLILLGVAGVLQPATSALLHNVSTIGISLNSMTELA